MKECCIDMISRTWKWIPTMIILYGHFSIRTLMIILVLNFPFPFKDRKIIITKKKLKQNESLPYKQQHLSNWAACLQIQQKHNLHLQIASLILAGNPLLLGPSQILQKEHDILLACQNTGILPQTEPRTQTCPVTIAAEC